MVRVVGAHPLGGVAIFPVLFAGYFSAFFPWAGDGAVPFFSFGPIHVDLAWVVGVVFVIIPMALLNIRGSKSVGDSALLFMVVALLPLLIIAGLGIYRLVTEGINPFTPFIPEDTPPTAALALGLSVVMWAYCAFDRVGLIAGEIKDPGKTIPKAMVVSMIIIVLTYALPLLGALAVPGWEDWFAGSFSDVALVLGGPWLQIFVTIGGMFCAIGLYSSLLMSSTRTPFVLSQDRWLTPALSRQSRKTGSPVVSIIVCSVIYAFFTTADFLELVVLDVFLINLLLLFNLAALIILRIKEPNLKRPTRLPWGVVRDRPCRRPADGQRAVPVLPAGCGLRLSRFHRARRRPWLDDARVLPGEVVPAPQARQRSHDACG